MSINRVQTFDFSSTLNKKKLVGQNYLELDKYNRNLSAGFDRTKMKSQSKSYLKIKEGFSNKLIEKLNRPIIVQRSSTQGGNQNFNKRRNLNLNVNEVIGNNTPLVYSTRVHGTTSQKLANGQLSSTRSIYQVDQGAYFTFNSDNTSEIKVNQQMYNSLRSARIINKKEDYKAPTSGSFKTRYIESIQQKSTLSPDTFVNKSQLKYCLTPSLNDNTNYLGGHACLKSSMQTFSPQIVRSKIQSARIFVQRQAKELVQSEALRLTNPPCLISPISINAKVSLFNPRNSKFGKSMYNQPFTKQNGEENQKSTESSILEFEDLDPSEGNPNPNTNIRKRKPSLIKVKKNPLLNQERKFRLENALLLGNRLSIKHQKSIIPDYNPGSWEVDKTYAEQQTLQKMKQLKVIYQAEHDEQKNSKKQKMKNVCGKIKLILTLSKIRKDKSKDLRLLQQMKNDINLKPILEKDVKFKYMLQKAMPDTKYFINKMFHQVESDFIIKEDFLKADGNYLSAIRNVMSQKVQTYKKNKEAEKDISNGELMILTDLSKSKKMKSLYKNNKEQKKTQVVYVHDVVDLPQQDGNIGGMVTQKIRMMIQKHFLSGFPHSLKEKKPINFDFMILDKLGNFKRSFIQSLPENYTIGKAYSSLRCNMYSLDYIDTMLYTQNMDKKIADNSDKEEPEIQAKFDVHDADQLFNYQILQDKFYGQVKKVDPKLKNETQKAMQVFFETSEKQKMLSKPTFLHIFQNEISLQQEIISDRQAMAIQKYFEMTKNVPDKQIYSLTIENCTINDSNLAKILKGIQSQQNSKNGHTLLHRFILQNSCFGIESSKVFNELAHDLKEIWINNIQTNLNRQVAKNIVQSICQNSQEIHKIKLSNINLNDEILIENLIKVFIDHKQDISCINLSNTKLTSKQLCQIMEEIKRQPQYLKSLDLSYNQVLVKKYDKREGEIVKNFVKNFKSFLTSTVMLNHMDISGMNLDQQHITQLCEIMQSCPNLMSIHMNDLGINHFKEKSSKLILQILHIFKLDDINIENATRARQTVKDLKNDHEITQTLFHLKEQNKITNPDFMKIKRRMSLNPFEQKMKLQMLQELDLEEESKSILKTFEIQLNKKVGDLVIQELIDEKMNLRGIENKVERNNRILKLIEETEKQGGLNEQSLKKNCEKYSKLNYKDRLFKCKQSKLINKNKLQLQSKNKNGMGYEKDSSHDQFVLTRKINCPELIWNQDVLIDHLPKKRFFEVDAAMRWRISQKNECFMCDGYQYSIIFFRQGLVTQDNQSLHEIQDPQMVQSLKNNYDYNFSQGNVQTPIICGSVVDGGDQEFPYSRMNFERKLRMMRVELFATLGVSESTNYVQQEVDSQNIKQGIVEYSKKEMYQTLEALNILPQISDWGQILYDKCLNNDLTDVHVENAEDADFQNYIKGKDQKNLFVYANWLKPGLHKFLIYCPTSQRAYVKSMLINTNKKDFYPELPEQLKKPRKKLILNVWHNCKQDNTEIYSQMSILDVEVDSFNLELYIKNEDEQLKVKELIHSSYHIYKQSFLELIIQSGKYPRIDNETMLQFGGMSLGKIEMQAAQVEIQYIRACRLQKVKNIEGQLNRSEFIELMTRLAVSAYPKLNPSLSLQLINQFLLQPIVDKQKYISERLTIQDNRPLNKLLYENRNGLNYIFDKHSSSELGLHKLNAEKLIRKIFPDIVNLEDKFIHQSFVYSLQTIVDDMMDKKKYFYLAYNEFLEFIARISIKIFSDEHKNLDHKVFYLIELLFNQEGITSYQKAYEINPDIDLSLQPINEKEECC